MENKRIVTAEAVRAGHPDKLCDQIADTILDAHLKQDPNARVAVEVFVTDSKVLVAGEVTSKAKISYQKIVWETLGRLRYSKADLCSDPNGHIDVEVRIHEQSPDIAGAVDGDGELGAGDQGIMVGYATDETAEMLPLPVVLAQRICRELDRMQENVSWMGADGKAQVSVVYDGIKPMYVRTIVISTQHKEGVCRACLTEAIVRGVVMKCIPMELIHPKTELLVNPSGSFVLGGPVADTGLTGRKLAVDQYGPAAHIGGGAFCVDGETEYLTPTGWKQISDYHIEDMVAEWDNNELRYVYPQNYTKTRAENLFHISSVNALDMVLSENHDLVLITGKGNVIKKRLKEFMPNGVIQNGHFGTIPTSFSYHNGSVGVPYSDAQIRLQVAFCADGTIPTNNRMCRVRVKRERKKQRIEMLLQSTQTEYRKSEDGEYAIYWFSPPMREKLLSNLFWNANSHQLSIIAQEAMLWDGDEKKRVFRTTHKAEADFMQFAFMASYGTNASIITDDRTGERYGNQYERKSVLYEVYLKMNKGTDFRYGGNCKPLIRAVPYQSDDPFMYCFTVSSGMLVLRRHNHVFVTGNSGKDPTKVDRSGAYMARYVAKNIVAAGLAMRCEVQIAYVIGKAEPVSVSVETFGTGVAKDSTLAECVRRVFDLRPAAIIKQLDLLKPIYAPLAAYGHYGRPELRLSWERMDKKDALYAALRRLLLN